MRILLLIRSLEIGGAERQMTSLARGLKARGHEVFVAVLYSGGSLEEELQHLGIPILPLGNRGRYDVARHAARLIGVARRSGAEVVYGMLSAANLSSLLLRLRSPSPAVIWGLRASYVNLGHYDSWTRVTTRLEALLSRFADRIIVNSRAGREHAVASGFPQCSLVVVPNGIDTSRFRADLEARRRIRESWNVRPDEKAVGIVGRIDPMKDHSNFLEAAAGVAALRTAVRFLCIGEGRLEQRRSLEALSASMGLSHRLTWVGVRNDMPGVYSALDLVVLSSRGEGFPNVVAEAMACGTPCVVTDVGDAAEIVEDRSRVVPPGDPAALAEAIHSALERDVSGNECESMRRRIEERFGIDRMVDATENVFRSALAGRPGAGT
jgi:glycosyltransferase involved in cell wall biosynthesis